MKQGKRSLWQSVCQACVLWILAAAVRRCYPFLTRWIVDELLNAWPKTVATTEARKICPLLAEAYVKAVERGNVDAASNMVWLLKHRGTNNSSVQEKFFEREVSDRLSERFSKATPISSPEGAWDAERALRDLDRLECRDIDPRLLEKAISIQQRATSLLTPTSLAPTSEAAERKNALRKFDNFDPLNVLRRKKLKRLERRKAAGRRLTYRDEEFLLKHAIANRT